jgi:MFS family permease
MRAVLRQRNFALLWVATLISRMGDFVLFIALPLYVYQLTGSALATSGMVVAELLPALVLGSVAGVFVDRWDRKRTIVVSNLLLALGLLPLLAVQVAHAVWIVYIVALLQSVLAQFLTPAENAMLPSIVGEQHLVPANALNALSNNLARLIGPAGGGLIATIFGLRGLTVIDAVSFLIAGGMVARVTTSGKIAQVGTLATAELVTRSWKTAWHAWLEGLAFIRRERFIRIMLAVMALTALGEGVFGVMFVIWVKQALGGGVRELGWLASAQAVGGLFGGFLAGYAGKRLSPIQLAGLGGVAFGLLDVALFSFPRFVPRFWVGLLLIVLVGLPSVSSGTGRSTLLQSRVRNEYRGRVFGVLGTTSALLMLTGALIAGGLGGVVGPITLLTVLQGGAHILAGVLVLTLLPRAAQARTSVSTPK